METRKTQVAVPVLLAIMTLMVSRVVFAGKDSLHERHMAELQAVKASLVRRNLPGFVSPPPTPPQAVPGPRVYQVISYGADPTGKADSTNAILKAMEDAFDGPNHGVLMEGINDLGGARIDLQGGSYLISKPLRFPSAGAGNLLISGGTLRASDDFPVDKYLIELNDESSKLQYIFEYITLRDLLIDCNYRGGAIAVINSLRTSIDNCYITRFGDTNGILVQKGHETYIRNSFLGQHITAGGDKGERNFSGTAVNLVGNDNAITDTVVFSAAIGVMISGQANLLSGVHCYNKATGFGGTGIYLKLPGLTQNRIVNSYLDYTGIVAEDPVQLQISGTFFLGDAFILLKSINGVVRGVNIVDNMFSGSDNGVQIVQLDQTNKAFENVDQVVVDRNNVNGMATRSTVAKASVAGNGTSWTVDFNQVLLFPNLIKHVQYTLVARDGNAFPIHAVRNVSDNRVVVQTNAPVTAQVYVTVDQ
ncbi:PREDICTED: polygalacturonase QRT3 [Brassica oleracea var. oleracea]|uniref:Rhamnogalacturonase A/B/Epimerase-like pectate lyase domain-containing protein n=1 Tax=Brassica oleracea var. oleracea TaxID=109376 RepID=A0A0D3A4J6_BRAOL|nr:PREDICTED: polygalacturonase QRT3 [Brassica oleracea var. oleracea]